MIRSLAFNTMIRFLSSKSSAANASMKRFDIQQVKNQLLMAEEFIVTQLKDLKPDTALEGKLIGNVNVTIKNQTVKLKELAQVSQKNHTNWMVLVSDEEWMKQVKKAIKQYFPHLSPTEKDVHTLLIPVPPVTKERKLEILKEVKKKVENSRQAVRNIRAAARSDLKNGDLSDDQRFKAEKQIQDLVDNSLKKLDKLQNEKQKSFEKS